MGRRKKKGNEVEGACVNLMCPGTKAALEEGDGGQ